MTADYILGEAKKSVTNLEQYWNLIVVHCAHSTTAPITNRLLNKQKFQNNVIISWDWEVNFNWNSKQVHQLLKEFSGCGEWAWGAWLNPHTDASKEYWEQWGGSVPKNAYFGWYPDQKKFLKYVIDNFSEQES